LGTLPISKLRTADDERRQAKRNSLAGKLTIEENALADLKVEKAKFDGDKKVVQAELARSAIWRRCLAPTARRSGHVVAVSSDADTVVSAKAQDGVQEGRRARQARRGRTGLEKRMGEAL
jgi:hypothetical protein